MIIKVVGKIKDEYGGKSILKFVGLNQICTQYYMKVVTKRAQTKTTVLL